MKMILAYIPLILLFISEGESQGMCESPYICKTIEECLREQTDGTLKGGVTFPCGFNKICCHTTVKTKPMMNTNNPKPTSTTTQKTITVEEKKASYSSHPNFKFFTQKCGIGILSEKVIDGNDTSLTEFPWMVLLGYKDRKGKINYWCGGTLISDRFVLTAAHCMVVNGLTVTTVRLGEWDIEQEIDCVGGICNDPTVDIKVQRRIPHSSYDKSSNRHDIALLLLSSSAPIKGSKRINIICLPWNITHLNIGDDYLYEAAGWGLTGNGEEGLHHLLQKVALKGVTLDVCNKQSCSGTTIPACPIKETQICAQGDIRKDVCKGDSGGPLMSTSVPYIYQIGVTSIKTTQECGLADIPSIFTRVESYLPWILEKVNQ